MGGRPRLGQHFLRDRRAARRIAALIPPGVPVVEIGPGRGALTRYLVQKDSPYIGVELDGDLVRRLRERFGGREGFVLVEGDFLTYEPPSNLESLWLAGNIPYSISSKIVQRATGERRCVGAVLMFQREFAERLTAGPGKTAYGSLSVYVNYHWETRAALTLKPTSFSPPPGVDSKVVVLHRREAPPVAVDNEEAFFTMVRAAFAHRRKQLANADIAGLDIDRPSWLRALEQAGIERTHRAQELSLEDFARLYKKVEVSGGAR
ncbi:ribosomal RNA small subunit methyltransferase A [bacterium]|nr:ribosomal RNA small subunit methyltransferase A [bacterium]